MTNNTSETFQRKVTTKTVLIPAEQKKREIEEDRAKRQQSFFEQAMAKLAVLIKDADRFPIVISNGSVAGYIVFQDEREQQVELLRLIKHGGLNNIKEWLKEAGYFVSTTTGALEVFKISIVKNPLVNNEPGVIGDPGIINNEPGVVGEPGIINNK